MVFAAPIDGSAQIRPVECQPPCRRSCSAGIVDDDWANWDEQYDFVFVLFGRTEDDNQDPDYLTLVTCGRKSQLYAVKRDRPGEDLHVE